MLEAVRISLAGYPTRRNYSDFVDRFGLLAPEFMDERCAFLMDDSKIMVAVLLILYLFLQFWEPVQKLFDKFL